MNPKVNPTLLSIQNDNKASTTADYKQIRSTSRKSRIQNRESGESGEDAYFEWANKNRRPVEYFAGRKRDIGKIPTPDFHQFNQKRLWRTGLNG